MSSRRLLLIVVLFMTAAAPLSAAISQEPDAPARGVRRAQRARERAAPKQEQTTSIVRLQHATCSELADVLHEITAHENQETKPRIVADPRTNSIVVMGTDSAVERILNVARQLDVPSNDADVPAVNRPLRTSLQLLIYKLDVPADHLPDISVDQLTESAGAPESLEKALSKLGDARLAYRMDQVVELRSRAKRIRLGAQTPYVRNTSDSKGGDKRVGVGYENVGCTVEYAGNVGSPTGGTAQLEIEYSDVSESQIDIGNDVKAPVIRKWTQSYGGPFKGGQPMVLLMIDANADGDPVAYVTCIQFTIESF